jgi:hypothetical protein
MSYYNTTIERDPSLKQFQKEAKKQEGTFPVVADSDVLYNGPFGQLAIPKTAQAAKELGTGTKWCTTDAGPFKQYNREGPLYVWRDRSGDKFQFHIKTNPPSKVRLVDAQDRYVKAPEAKQFKEHPVIGQIIKEQDKIYRDESNVYRSTVPSTVDKVYTVYNGDGYEMYNMRLRSERVIQIGDKLCLTEDHDVLTLNKGWVPINHVSLDDKVGQLNPIMNGIKGGSNATPIFTDNPGF